MCYFPKKYHHMLLTVFSFSDPLKDHHILIDKDYIGFNGYIKDIDWSFLSFLPVHRRLPNQHKEFRD